LLETTPVARRRFDYSGPGVEIIARKPAVTTAARDSFASPGPTQPTWVVQLVGSYLKCTGRDDNVAAGSP